MGAFLQIALVILTALGFLTGCTGPQLALATGNHDAMFSMMRGNLAMSQRPDGTQAFTYVVLANAYDGFVDTADQEKVRLDMIAGQLGQGQHCPRGYVIDKRTENTKAVHAIVYEGHCK